MKRILVAAGVVVGVLLLGAGGTVGYFSAIYPPSFPDTPMPEIEASDDPAVIARGEYLANGVAHCDGCHAPLDAYVASKGGPPAPLSGGREFAMGPIGTIRSANITPDEATGIGGWSDAEIARAVRHGVGKDGKALPLMFAIGGMSDEDLTALVSYLRSVAPVNNEVEPSEVGLLGKVLFRTAMAKFIEPHEYPAPAFVPEGEVSAERGAYLALGPAACGGCHSKLVSTDTDGDGLYDFTPDGPVGAGGEIFPDEADPAYEYAAINLSRDATTSPIASWSEQDFVDRIAAGRVYESSPMPWESFARMSENDLRSIWKWIETVPPTERVVGPGRREAGWSP